MFYFEWQKPKQGWRGAVVSALLLYLVKIDMKREFAFSVPIGGVSMALVVSSNLTVSFFIYRSTSLTGDGAELRWGFFRYAKMSAIVEPGGITGCDVDLPGCDHLLVVPVIWSNTPSRSLNSFSDIDNLSDLQCCVGRFPIG